MEIGGKRYKGREEERERGWGGVGGAHRQQTHRDRDKESATDVRHNSSLVCMVGITYVYIDAIFCV